MTPGDDAVHEKTEHSGPTPSIPPARADGEDDVIRIVDLAPPEDVHGGRKILLGEFPTPVSAPRIPPES